jgi:translation initiation factor 4E
LEQVFALIGEQFETTEYICGIVISTRYNEDLLSVWTKDSGNQEAQNKIL